MPFRYARIAGVSLFCFGLAFCAHQAQSQDTSPSYRFFSQPRPVQPAQQATLSSLKHNFADSEPVSQTFETQVPKWPAADSLIEQIERVQSIPEMRQWSQATKELLTELSSANPNSSAHANCLQRLQAQSNSLPQINHKLWRRFEQATNRSTNSQFRIDLAQQHCDVSRLSYRLSRRLEVWNSLVGAQIRGRRQENLSDSPFNSASFHRMSFDHIDPQWIEYLQLVELQSNFSSLNPNPVKQRAAARKVLARIYSPVLTPHQSEYVRQVIGVELVGILRKAASEPVNQEDLVKRIEKYETRSSAATGYYLNDLYQSLLWSSDPGDQAVAAKLQTHYRNANFRMAVSQQFLNRLIPALPSTASPVSQNVNGARVSGQSHVSNQLMIDLVPDAKQIMLNLTTLGQVQSDTIARTKTFRVQNQGHAEFQVVQPIVISPRGIDSSAKPYSQSTGNQAVINLQSTLDDIPLIGRFARAMASKKLREDAPKTDRMFQQTVKSTAETQMQQQVEVQIAKLRHKVYAHLYQPLLAMELEPEAVQMATTDEQIIMRYRLAGRDQMAAHTARPSDDGSSLISFQVHESAINNAIARIGLNGKLFTIDELKTHMSEVLGIQPKTDEQPSDGYAEIGFAPLDPMHIAFKDDRLLITLNLKSIKVSKKGKVWRNVALTAAYKIVSHGTQVYLEQDDNGTRRSGKGLKMGDKIALSGIMKKLFQQQYSFDALPKMLQERMNGSAIEVSQLVVSDGWLAVSMDDVQQRPYANQLIDGSRIGALRRLINRK